MAPPRDQTDDDDLSGLMPSPTPHAQTPAATAKPTVDDDDDLSGLLPGAGSGHSVAPEAHNKPSSVDPRITRAAVGKNPDDGDDISLTEALSQAGHNFLPDAGEMIKNIPKAVTSLPALAKGLKSKGEGWLGIQQDEKTKKDVEGVVDAIGKHYSDTYGSWKGFKKELAKHPAGIATDLSPLVSGGLGFGAEAVGATSGVGRALSIASKFTDPVSAAVNGVGAVGKVANSVGKFGASRMAGVSKNSLDMAQRAGETADPVLRNAFKEHFNGSGDATDILDTAQKAFAKRKAEESAKFADAKQQLSANQTTPSFSVIDRAIADARLSTRPGGINHASVFPAANSALDEIEAAVTQFKQTPSLHNLEGFDTLKQNIGDIWDRYGGNKKANQIVGGVYNQARDAIGSVNPKYFELMEQWQKGINDLNEIKRSGGLTSGAAASTAVKKLLKDSPNSKKILAELAEHEPTLPFKLAGAELRPWSRMDMRELVALGLSGLAGYVAGVPHGLGVLATTSPKLMGHVQRGIGKISNLSNSAVGKGAKYATGEVDNALRDGSDADEDPSSSAPRNLRNNNPGNVMGYDKDSGVEYKFTTSQPGYVGRDDDGYAKFDTPEHGQNAGVNLVRNYLKNGNDTVRKIAEKWSPRGPNSDAAVNGKIARMSRELGVQPDRQLDRNDSTLPARIFSAIAKTEGEAPRITRASGGRVVNHEAEAQRLIAEAESGLKSQNKSTEPLLGMHDDAVASALKTADSYI